MRIRSIKGRSIGSLKSIFLALICSSLFYSGAFAQNKPDFPIGILLEERSAEIEALLPQLQKEIIAVVGEDATVSFPEKWILSNNNDRKKAEENLKLLNAQGPEMILAFGAINSVVVTKQQSFPKPTLLFGAVPADFISITARRESSGINNFVYLITSHSLREDLNAFRDLYAFKDLGIAVNKTITDNLGVEEYLANVFSDSAIQHTLIPFSDVSDIIAELDEIDALYIEGGDFFNAEEVSLLVGELNLRKIPSMTATAQQDVEAGILATRQSRSNVEQLFRRIALSVEAVVNGTNPSELPLYFEPREELTINFNTAEILGIPIRYSQIARTNLVGDLDKLGAEKKYDLKMLMEEVLLTNLGLKVNQLSVDLVDQDVRLAKSNYLPNLEFAATGTNVDPALAEVSNGQNPEFSTAANATVSQVIYAPGASANIRIQKELLEAEKENLNTEKLNVIFDASTLYFNSLLVKANLQITKSNMDLTEENLKLAQQRFESGEAGKSDVLRFQSQLAQNTQQFVEGYNQLQQAYFTINQLLNQPIRRRIDVLDASLDDGIYSEYSYDRIKDILDDPNLIEPFISFLINEAKKNSPELKSLNYNLQANNHNIWLNKQGRFLPTVALQGQVVRNISRSGAGSEFPPGFGSIPNSYYTLGLNVSIPIFQQNQRNINRQAAIIQREQLLANQDNLALNIDQSVSSAVLQVINQIANLELSKVSESTAKESLELTQEAYRTGGVNWVQLIDAQNNYFQAQLANATAVYNFLSSALSLERNIGYFFILNSAEKNEDFRQRFRAYLENDY